MVKKVAGHLDKGDLTLEIAAVIGTERETTVSTVTETEASLDKNLNENNDLKILEVKVAELEAKLLKLQTELTSLLKGKKTGKKRGDKVKCKCKGKTVDIAKCKCKNKKLDKIKSNKTGN